MFIVNTTLIWTVQQTKTIKIKNMETQNFENEKFRDLILNDVERCTDIKCPTGAFCARSIQLSIDYKKGVENMPKTDFQGYQKRGLCDYFLNADVIAAEQDKP